MMMNSEISVNPVFNVIVNVLGEPKKHNKLRHQLQYNCPVCDEDNNKGNLEVNYQKMVMKCWKCCDLPDGLKGSLRTLLKKFGTHLDVKLYDNLTEGIIFNSNSKTEISTIITLPEEFNSFLNANVNSNEYKEALNYLKDRGVSSDIIAKYNIGYCTSGTYSGRIIIPSYDIKGKLNYFVSRSYVGHKIKYKNPQIPKDNLIINEMNINWNSTIYLVEGMFDMIGLGIKNTIPLLGKVLHDKLYLTLLEKAKGYIIILLDPDAERQAIQIYHKLNNGRLINKVRFINLPNNHDIADINKTYGKKGIINTLMQNRELTLEDLIKN